MKHKILVPAEWLEAIANDRRLPMWLRHDAQLTFSGSDRYCPDHDTVYSVEQECEGCRVNRSNEG